MAAGGLGATGGAAVRTGVTEGAAAAAGVASPAAKPAAPAPAKRGDGLTTLTQGFDLRHRRALVWQAFRDVEQVARCLPGAALTQPVADNRLKGRITVKLGPIGANFVGEAEMTLDDAGFSGVIEGGGRDRLSATRAKGRVAYRLLEAEAGAATRVEIELAFALAGPLAQFGRGGIVTDLATRLTAAFAANLQVHLDTLAGATPAAGERDAGERDAGRLLLSAIWARIKAVLAAILGRS